MAVTEQGAEARAGICKAGVITKLRGNCIGSEDMGFLSISYEVCVMSELKSVYHNIRKLN